MRQNSESDETRSAFAIGGRGRLRGIYGWFLERCINPDWYVTFTFRDRTDRYGEILKPTRKWAEPRLRSFFQELERTARCDIAWVWVGDFGHFDARYHVHALVSGVAHLRRDEWWSRANQSFGRSEVKKFRERGGAAQYTAGHALTETGDIEFGGRLLETKMKAAQNTTRSQGIGASTHDRGQRRDVPLHRVYIDGAGARPDGMGSGYAYLNETTGRQRVKRIDGLTNNQAEYRGLKYALMNVPKGSRVTIFTDSQIVCFQFNGTYRVRDAALQQLLARVKEIIRERRLLVTIEWVPRERNQAGPLLEQRPC